MNQNGHRNFQTKRKVTLLYFLLASNRKGQSFHLQIKELKLDHSKQLQAICCEMKILQKNYVQGNWNTYIRTIYSSWSQAPLNNTTPRVTFLQNQQPVTTHSMNPLMLPFLPTPNHQTRLLMQKNPKMSSPQNKNNISVLHSLRYPLHSNSWQFPKSLPMLNFCETQSCYIICFFCWSTESQMLQCLINPQNQISQNNGKQLRRKVLLQL